MKPCASSIVMYCVIWNIPGIKLLRLDYLASIFEKSFSVASKTHVILHQKIVDKTFAVQGKSAKSANVLSLEHIVLFAMADT